MKNLKLKIYNFFGLKITNNYLVSVKLPNSNIYTFSIMVNIDNFNKPIRPLIFAKAVKNLLLEEFNVESELEDIQFNFISFVNKNY